MSTLEPFSAFGAPAGLSPGLSARVAAFNDKMRELITEDSKAPENVFIGGPPHTVHVRPPPPAAAVTVTQRLLTPAARGSAQIARETETVLVSKGWHKWKASDMEAQMALADVIVVN